MAVTTPASSSPITRLLVGSVAAPAPTSSIPRPSRPRSSRPFESPRATSSSVGHSRGGHVDALATERHALGDQVAALTRALGQRAVGADHPPPGQVGVVDLEENGARKARRTRRYVAIGPHEALRDLAHALQHFHLPSGALNARHRYIRRTGSRGTLMRWGRRP